jgi:two-component system NtrC family sensor kinase
MKRTILAFSCALTLLLALANTALAGTATDSLKNQLANANDSTKVTLLVKIGNEYSNSDNFESALSSYLSALKLSEAIQNKQCLFFTLYNISNFYEGLNKHQQALEFGLRALKTAEDQGNKNNIYTVLDLLGGLIYFNQGQYDKTLACGQRMLKIAQEQGDKEKICYLYELFGDTYRAQQKYDESIAVFSKSVQAAREINNITYIYGGINGIGMAYEAKGQLDTAVTYYLEAFNGLVKAHSDPYNFEFHVAAIYFRLKNYPKAIFYCKDYLSACEKKGDYNGELRVYDLLKNIYAADNNYKEAFNTVELYNKLRLKINSDDIQNRINLLQAGYNTEKQAKAIEYLQKQAALQARLRNLLIGAAVLLLVIAFLVANRYRLKKRSETALSAKNDELVHTIDRLKSTQAQLIQSEKMASLGELTAGIAHEIQNPLNFVNNFSEVNREMIDELKVELKDGNVNEALAIADEIKQNEEKINHHGKRADGIVKGMLQHSKTGSRAKELTNIHALAQEYMRLAYHGFYAKDKNFSVEMVTRFDEKMTKINVIPQDMGMVLFNLFNNAFYAVNQQAKKEGPDYKPVVEVETTLNPLEGIGQLKITDNGIGIPDAIKDKIMQPFFTTKPTGEGIGLGLSISYDIVVKGHGGAIQVNSVIGVGSEFTISLPVI